MTSSDDIQQRAAEWLIRRDGEERTPEAQARFEAWLAADSRHRAAYLELERTWRESDALGAWRPHDGAIDPAVLISAPERRSVATRRWSLALAASLVLAVIASVPWIAVTRDGSTYTTEIGGYQRVLLKDGSTVQLNTDTEVRVALGSDRREVRLVRGEAFFDVAHDPNRPFEVLAGTTVVHAVGTAFTVRVRDASDIEVIVTEGRVTLRSDDERAPGDAGGVSIPAPAISAGEGAIARPAGIAMRRISQPEVERRLAWQEGELEFNGESLVEVISEFNRYNRVRLEIVDPRLALIQVGGNFRATDLEGFVRALEASFPLRARESAGVIRLEARE